MKHLNKKSNKNKYLLIGFSMAVVIGIIVVSLIGTSYNPLSGRAEVSTSTAAVLTNMKVKDINIVGTKSDGTTLGQIISYGDTINDEIPGAYIDQELLNAEIAIIQQDLIEHQALLELFNDKLAQ